MAEGSGSKRCPVCGEGTLVDITYREGSNPEGVAEEVQVADSRQVETFSCGHEVTGPPLSDGASGSAALEVERRESEDTADTP